jgi:hypothetical protein
MLMLTYKEMKEVQEQYEKTARIVMGELPDTIELDAWLAKKYGTTQSYREISFHIVPTEEHREAYQKGVK